MKIHVTEKTLMKDGTDALIDLLKHVPNIQNINIHYNPLFKPGYRIDVRVDFNHNNTPLTLIVEIKSNGAPRFTRSAVYQLESYISIWHQNHGENSQCIPMFICPYISPESRSICLDHHINYLDLHGNAHLAFGNVYIKQSTTSKPKVEKRALRSLFSPKAGAILRVLLRNPNRTWRVAELAGEANASLGHVSNVRKLLLDREWIEIRKEGIVLVRPGDLLKKWRKSYHQPSGQYFNGYTIYHGDQLRNLVVGSLSSGPKPPRAIYSLNSAAQWYAPYVRSGIHSFYADQFGAQLLKETLNLTPAEKGANVILQILKDVSYFEDAVQPVPGIFCTNPIATYLDLWNSNDRNREAAEYLAGKLFPWI